MPLRDELLDKEFYHIYNRGINKENIFIENRDYVRFLNVIDKYKEKYNIKVIAWSLMPNHFHILAKSRNITTKTPKKLKALSAFLLKIEQSHAMYFKYKYEKKGAIFQGRFNAKIVYDDEYLITLLHYIHSQPSHHKIANDNDWPYSSIHNYINLDKKLITIDDYDNKFNKFKLIIETGLYLNEM